MAVLCAIEGVEALLNFETVPHSASASVKGPLKQHKQEANPHSQKQNLWFEEEQVEVSLAGNNSQWEGSVEGLYCCSVAGVLALDVQM